MGMQPPAQGPVRVTVKTAAAAFGAPESASKTVARTPPGTSSSP
jgi:hypothetical protein